MKRAPISACLGWILICGIAGTAMGQGKSSTRPVRQSVQAEQVSSPADVHITPSTMRVGSTSMEAGSDHWSARGYDLKTLISQIYDMDSRRIDYAEDGSGNTRYDVNLTLTDDVDDDGMQRMLKDALEKKFRLTITPESRAMDVYVLTAPNGPGSALHRHGTGAMTKLAAGDAEDFGLEAGQQITYEGRDCTGKSSANGIAASAGSISEFRRTLEPDLDRLLVDETNLKGNYDFKIGNYANQQELFKLLHEQLGIMVTAAQRKVTMLTVRPTQVMQAAM
jgi:uncharacterized protein (TIGR03435 family)